MLCGANGGIRFHESCAPLAMFVENGTDAKPECLLLNDDCLHRFLL